MHTNPTVSQLANKVSQGESGCQLCCSHKYKTATVRFAAKEGQQNSTAQPIFVAQQDCNDFLRVPFYKALNVHIRKLKVSVLAAGHLMTTSSLP